MKSVLLFAAKLKLNPIKKRNKEGGVVSLVLRVFLLYFIPPTQLFTHNLSLNFGSSSVAMPRERMDYELPK